MSDPQDPLSSLVLVERAQRRDQEAIAILYDRYRDRLRAGLRRRLASKYRRALLDSEDLVHDGILAALQYIDRFEYRGSGSFLAWLLIVSEREVLKRIRSQHAQMRDRRREVEIEAAADAAAPEATPSQVAAGSETEERIAKALERLAPRERDAILLRRYLDLGAAEIAAELGLSSPGAVRALVSRAQAKLAALLDESAA